MESTIIIILAVLVLGLASNVLKNKRKEAKKETPNNNFDYSNGYKSKWLFSYNEKDVFHKIKEITDSKNLYLFAKVRLYDLVEPKQNIDKRQAHVFKIQAKHVDFVVCDEKLVARLIIELDDKSHDAQDRSERDKFVDTVLTNCGYKVLHIRAVEPEKLKNEIKSIFVTNSKNETQPPCISAIR